MPLQLSPCTPPDFPPAFTIISRAFRHEHPYIDAVFPSHTTPHGRILGGERLLAMQRTDPHTTFLKITDTETNAMIAVAKWNVYEGVVPAEGELEGEFWEGEEEREYARFLFREYLVPRRKAIREKGGWLVSLDILTVDPEHQRRGAGRMLVQWGTAVADKMGVETVVESSVYGRHLYESEGFEFVHDYVIELPEKWAGRDKQKFAWMVRPAKVAEASRSIEDKD